MQSAKEKNVKKEFRIASELAQVQKTSLEALEFLKPLTLDESNIFDIRLCLEEALINGIKHGNKYDPKLSVRLTVDADPERIFIEVQDQGTGFNPAGVEDCTTDENVFKSMGRGVFLIRNLMDEVQYNDKGNCLRMTKRLKK
jgi:serine/threonine-protein kinase RsbW